MAKSEITELHLPSEPALSIIEYNKSAAMKRWVLKAAVQKTFSLLPGGRALNYLLQKHATRGMQLTASHVHDKLEQLGNHLRTAEKFGSGVGPEQVLELGSGYHPVIPVALFLSGAERVTTADILPLYSRERVNETIAFFAEFLRHGNTIPGVAVQPARKETLERLAENHSLSLPALLQTLHIDYALGRPQLLNFGREVYDLVISNNTLQHIRSSELVPILENLRIAAKKEAVHSHFIDLIDQLHHFDRSLSRYNFLRYSPQQWKWIDNSIVHQNRLRVDDYRKIFADAGYVITEEQADAGFPDELSRLPLNVAFIPKSKADLLITHCTIVSQSN